MKTILKDRISKNRKKNVAALVAVFLIFATACSSSDVKVADESDIPTSEETGGGTEEAESGETDETTDEAATEETEESETEVAAEEEEEEEAFECPWDVGAKNGTTLFDPGGSFLVDARVGAHTDYDRFVLEFESGDAIPDSYAINWTLNKPEGEGSGLPVDVDGNVFLEISMGASFINWDGSEEAYDGPTSLSSALFGNIVEVGSGGYFEGRMLWAIGANEANGFQVLELDDPPRIVIDICTIDTSSTKFEDCVSSGLAPGFCENLFGDTEGASSAEATSGPCPPIPPLPAEAVPSGSYFADLNDDGIDEEAFSYFLPSEDMWHLRIVDGTDEFDHPIEGSSAVSSSDVLGAYDMQGYSPASNGRPELFVKASRSGGINSIAVFQLQDCEIYRPPTIDGTLFSFSYGSHFSTVIDASCVEGGSWLEIYTAEPVGGPPPTSWDVVSSRIGIAPGDDFWSVVPMSGGGSYTSSGQSAPISGTFDCTFE